MLVCNRNSCWGSRGLKDVIPDLKKLFPDLDEAMVRGISLEPRSTPNNGPRAWQSTSVVSEAVAHAQKSGTCLLSQWIEIEGKPQLVFYDTGATLNLIKGTVARVAAKKAGQKKPAKKGQKKPPKIFKKSHLFMAFLNFLSFLLFVDILNSFRHVLFFHSPQDTINKRKFNINVLS